MRRGRGLARLGLRTSCRRRSLPTNRLRVIRRVAASSERQRLDFEFNCLKGLMPAVNIKGATLLALRALAATPKASPLRRSPWMRTCLCQPLPPPATQPRHGRHPLQPLQPLLTRRRPIRTSYYDPQTASTSTSTKSYWRSYHPS